MSTHYQRDEFLERFDEWLSWEDPSPDDWIRRAVLSWILTRAESPYQGVTRASGFPNLWSGAVPGTEHGAGQVVVCSYWIMETQHRVRCESFAILSLPV